MNLIKKIFYYLKKHCSQEYKEIKCISKLPRYTKTQTNLLGNSFEIVDSHSFIGQYKEIIKRGIYYFFSEKKEPYIIDCGANIGISIYYFKKIYPLCKITAFEADPDIAVVLQSNINKNKFKNVEVIQKAVWKNNEYLSFYQEGSAGGRIINNLQHNNEQQKLQQVAAVRLKDYINTHIDLLKIDIEGAEVTVLEDISDKLGYIKNIFIEYHSQIDDIQKLDILLNILRNNNFRYFLETQGPNLNNPFYDRAEIDGFDNLINIYAFKQ